MDEDQNLQTLFDKLNQISAESIALDRTGGGTGGGAMKSEGSMDPNPLIKLNPYIAKNVTSFNHGGQFPTAAPSVGHFENQANQMIALNQISDIFKGVANKAMGVPAANKGMKMRKRYTQGGRF